MCGILGIAQFDQRQNLADVVASKKWQRAMERLAPRGPDDSGSWICESGFTAFGHTRLSIQDLSSSGRQPMSNEDGSVVITYNGEIYNAPLLREELQAAGHKFTSSSDTEVLVHGYEEWGIERLLDKILGMYAFGIWDSRERRLFLAVDHVSIKPLAWTYQDQTLFFGSDCDAVRAVAAPHCDELNASALCHVLCHGHIPHPMTLWHGIQKLQPGCYLSWIPGSEPSVHQHWSPPEDVLDTPASQGEFEELWQRVVSDHLLADVEVGLLLSGGLDSTSILSAVVESGQNLIATTLSMAGGDESPVARTTTQHFGTPHNIVPLQETELDQVYDDYCIIYDEPFSYSAQLTMVKVSQAARKLNKVVLSGDGGDEAFGGYLWHRKESAIGASNPARAALSERSFLHGYLQSVLPRFLPGEAEALFAPLGCEYGVDSYIEPYSSYDRPELPWPRRAQRIDLLSFCAGVILPKVDRASMAQGLEVRVPFLDKRILEWSLRQPVSPEELRSERGKLPLLRYLEPRVPAEVLDHPKQGFSLRLSKEVWLPMLERLRKSKLMNSGFINPRWEQFIAEGTDYRMAKIAALGLVAGTLEKRL